MYEKEELINLAKEAAKNAYAPYSNFKVGAAILCGNNKIYTGCNVENISFGATICAERVAMTKAVSEGSNEFITIAIYSDNEEYAYPCGICRQFLSEFAKETSTVLVFDKNKGIKEILFKDLIPYSFKF